MGLIDFNSMAWERLSELTYRKHFHGVNMTIAQFKLLKGSVIRPHSHPNEQISIVVSGRVKFIVGNDEYIVEGGNAVHIPPNATHSVEALEDSLVVDVYSPVRQDWIRGEDRYLREP